MHLEMREGDDDIGVCDGAADFSLLDIFAVFDRDERLVRALEAVGDQHMAPGHKRVKAVLIGGVEVVERVLAAADI